MWGQRCEWELISVQSGEVHMHQFCWKMVPIVAEWSSFLWDTSSLLCHVLKSLLRFDHLDQNQYNKGRGHTAEIIPSVPLRPGAHTHHYSSNPGEKKTLLDLATPGATWSSSLFQALFPH